MDKESKKEHKLPSMLEMSEMLDRVRSQIYPLSYNLEKLNNIQVIASQYEHLNPAVSIEEIARKIFEQQNLASANVIASSASAGLVQPQIREAIALQDSFRKIAEGLSVNNNVMLAAENAMQGMDRNNVYKDAMASFSQFRKSLKPLRDSLNTAGNAFNGSEFANLVRELQTSGVIPESTLSEYTGIVKHLESLKNLESFKALSRLENFPNDAELDKVSDTALEEPQTILAEVKRLDAKINKEVCTVDDFNDLSEETKRDSNLFLKYYYWLVMNLVVSLCLLEDSLGKDLDLSRKSFTIADNVGEVIIDIGHYWNGNKVALFNSFIVTQVNKLIGLIVN